MEPSETDLGKAQQDLDKVGNYRLSFLLFFSVLFSSRGGLGCFP